MIRARDRCPASKYGFAGIRTSQKDTFVEGVSVFRLLTAVSAPQADEVERMRMELLRVRFEEQLRGEKRKAAGAVIESQVTGTLKPCREVVNPHKDVAS